jgi:hypothetical protein
MAPPPPTAEVKLICAELHTRQPPPVLNTSHQRVAEPHSKFFALYNNLETIRSLRLNDSAQTGQYFTAPGQLSWYHYLNRKARVTTELPDGYEPETPIDMELADKLCRQNPLWVLTEQKKFEERQNLAFTLQRSKFWEHIMLFNQRVTVKRWNEEGKWIVEGKGLMAYYGGYTRRLLDDNYNESHTFDMKDVVKWMVRPPSSGWLLMLKQRIRAFASGVRFDTMIQNFLSCMLFSNQSFGALKAAPR